VSQDPGPSERASVRDGVLRTLAIATVLVSAVFVFGFLPRVSAPPVVTTERVTPGTMPPPGPTPTAEAAPGSPTAQPPASFDLEPPATAVARPSRVQGRPTGSDPAGDVWAAAVSDGLAALDRGSLAEARDAFARAESARPGTPSVRDGIARLQTAQKDASLTEHRSRALRAEAAEDWSTARNEYEAAQKLDPAVAFAVEGRPRATERRVLDERLEGYLKRPDRLTTEAVAHEAEAVLDRAAEVEQPGPRLARQMTALRAHLAAARLDVPVRLVSDGLTDVSVLRVGRLGAFKEKSLQLRPGKYVVVGTRKGYRDTRVILEVAAGRPAEPVRVRCEETL
jgi:eukaryotic-like serine/threonine-protein kinase